MRQIPQEIEGLLQELGIHFNERQALYIYSQGGISPPDFISERIARRIGTDKYLRAWAVLTRDKTLEEIARSNMLVQIENFPGLPPPSSARHQTADLPIGSVV